MKWIFLGIGFLLLFGVFIWLVVDLRQKIKKDHDDFMNGNHLK